MASQVKKIITKKKPLKILGSRGSSVSIVPGYGLDDQEIEARSPAHAK
jgi:hypothetical protein